MDDAPPVEPAPEVPQADQAEVPPAPAAQVPEPAPDSPPSGPEQQVHPWTKRSFGFMYGGRWLEGTAYQKDHMVDVSGWYGSLFYESLTDLMRDASFLPDQQTEILATIQRLIK